MALALFSVSAAGCDDPALDAAVAEGKEAKSDDSLFGEEPLNKAIAALKKKVRTPIQALNLLVYDDRVVLQAQDPKKPAKVDQYIYRAGRVAGPVPVKLMGKGKLEDNLFPLDAVNLESVPRLVDSAKEKAQIPEGKISRVLLKRNLPESMDIQFRVYVTNERRDAHIDADKDGNVIE